MLSSDYEKVKEQFNMLLKEEKLNPINKNIVWVIKDKFFLISRASVDSFEYKYYAIRKYTNEGVGDYYQIVNSLCFENTPIVMLAKHILENKENE